MSVVDPVSALALTGLSADYSGKSALRAVTATFPRGSMSAIVGPNGAGKSTLLKAVLGLLEPSAGTVAFFGQPLEMMRKRIAYVPQRAVVDWDFPAVVREIVAMGLYREMGLLGRVTRERQRHIEACLRELDIANLAERQIGALSGGQQQRVFLARALAQQADLLLLDEPLAGVDAPTEAVIMQVLRRLRDSGKTVVAVHHDLSTVPHYFDRVLLLNGTVIAEGAVGTAFTASTIRAAYGAAAVMVAPPGVSA